MFNFIKIDSKQIKSIISIITLVSVLLTAGIYIGVQENKTNEIGKVQEEILKMKDENVNYKELDELKKEISELRSDLINFKEEYTLTKGKLMGANLISYNGETVQFYFYKGDSILIKKYFDQNDWTTSNPHLNKNYDSILKIPPIDLNSNYNQQFIEDTQITYLKILDEHLKKIIDINATVSDSNYISILEKIVFDYYNWKKDYSVYLNQMKNPDSVFEMTQNDNTLYADYNVSTPASDLSFYRANFLRGYEGFNDNLDISRIYNQKYSIKIYTANGELVFSRDTISSINGISWDEIDNNGKKVPVGTYFYQVNFDSTCYLKEPLSGTVTVTQEYKK